MAKVRLSDLSIEDLKKEIQRRQAALPGLIAQRDELDRKIADLQALGPVDPALAAPKAPSARSARVKVKRAKNKVSLPQVLTTILKAKPGQSVAELTQAVLAAGYKSTSKDFKAIVTQTLYRDERFKRVASGRFAVKG